MALVQFQTGNLALGMLLTCSHWIAGLDRHQGLIWKEWSECWADRHSSAEFIAVCDSDVVLSTFGIPQLLFQPKSTNSSLALRPCLLWQNDAVGRERRVLKTFLLIFRRGEGCMSELTLQLGKIIGIGFGVVQSQLGCCRTVLPGRAARLHATGQRVTQTHQDV